MPYYIINLSKFKAFQTKDWNTAKQFAELFELEVKQSSTPSESLVVISLDTNLTDLPIYKDQPLGIGA